MLAAIALCAAAGCGRSVEVPAPGAEPAPALPAPPVSTISIPVSVDLRGAFAEAEATVPKRFEQLKDWMKISSTPVGDVGAKYEIWRSPLKLGVSGTQLTIGGDIYYRFKIAQDAPFIGWKELASCGYGEPARMASLQLRTALSWTDDWRLQSNTTVLPISFVNRCRVTALNIDVTDRVSDAFDVQLATAARQIDRQLSEQADLSRHVHEIWRKLQQPVELADGMWLRLAPTTATVTPLSGGGSSVTATVNVSARPRIVVGARPEASDLQLPALRTAPAENGFHITVDSEISFAEANRRLGETLVGSEHRAAGHRVAIRSATVYGSGGRAVLALGLRGDVNGRIFLVGTPAYDPERRIIYLRSLDYSLETKHALARAADWLGHENFRASIIRQARFPLDDYLSTAAEELHAALNRPIADGVLSRGSVSRIEPLGVYVTDDGFVARAAIQGDLRLVISS